jgi:hypothetical protein
VVGITSQQGENMTDEGFASTGGVVRLLETEPTHEERYAHAFALLALLKPTSANEHSSGVEGGSGSVAPSQGCPA